jgi:hypothetical protein
MIVPADRCTALVRKSHIRESLSYLRTDELEIDSRYRKLGEFGHCPRQHLWQIRLFCSRSASAVPK